MTATRWLEFGGQRVLQSDVPEFTEYRCDVCGQVVTVPVIIQMQVFMPSGRATGLPQYHLHEACLRQNLPFTTDDLAKYAS